MDSPPILKENPDWLSAAQSLVNACVKLQNQEERVKLLEKLCVQLGAQLYPAFLEILCCVERHGDKQSQSLITGTLVHALTTGRIPSGKMSAWGANSLSEGRSFGNTRSLGPIEYLCAWYSQPTDRHRIPANSFQKAMSSLLTLISSNVSAKNLYCEKLKSDAEDPIGGTLSSKTRTAISQLAIAWQQDLPQKDIIDIYFDALQGTALERLSNINSLFPR